MFAEWPAETERTPDAALDRRVWALGDLAIGLAILGLGFLAVIAIQVLLVGLGAVTDAGSIDAPRALLTLSFEALLGVVTLLLAVRRGLTWHDIGLRVPKRWRWVAATLVGVYAALVAYQLVLQLLARLGVDTSRVSGGNELPVGDGASLATWILLGVAVVVVAPIAEELFFRGLIFRALAGRMRVPAAYVLSGVVFAAFHLNLSVVVPFSAIGLVFAWAFWNSGSLWTTMVAHAVVNGLSFTIAVAGAVH
ncbi:MAG: type II CAAX endopeptidase family protein [Chloroflexi bacterium]|nr:type II CAAX endopeptidase family protein [Chloroflexota bacterium]MQC27503.1 CPBP family intramembrane metalloprotease [Chloroflexota bacterium]